jgi:hypothetical protein
MEEVHPDGGRVERFGALAQSIGGFGHPSSPSGRSHLAEDTRRGNHNLATTGHPGNVGLYSFKPKDPPESDGHPSAGERNAPADFGGEKHSNETHRSTTDLDARLYRKGLGMAAKLCFISHGMMENRWGLISGSCLRTDTRLTRVSGHAERLAALDGVQHVAEHPCAIPLGTDRGNGAADFIKELGSMNVRAQVAQNTSRRRSAIDKRTTRHPGYVKGQRVGKRIEQAFGWIKTVAGLRKIRLRGLPQEDWAFTFAAAADTLMQVPKLVGAV